MNAHFVDPEYFLVSYWPGVEPTEDNVQTIRTESKLKMTTSVPPSC